MLNNHQMGDFCTIYHPHLLRLYRYFIIWPQYVPHREHSLSYIIKKSKLCVTKYVSIRVKRLLFLSDLKQQQKVEE